MLVDPLPPLPCVGIADMEHYAPYWIGFLCQVHTLVLSRSDNTRMICVQREGLVASQKI